MITKQTAKKYFTELVNELNKDLEKKFETALSSGALDLSQYNSDYIVPKIILIAALNRQDKRYLINKTYLSEAERLEYFI